MEISVCLIVKNEENNIRRCLDCVKKFADEIIVVDTGSRDKTKEILKEYTDNIFDFEWVDDFSKARNFSFSKATKEYVMWLDADDVISNKEIDKINLLKINMTADTYMLKYVTAFDENCKPIFTYYRERILKRQNNPIWQGFVHEAIAPFGLIEYLDITIEHHKQSVSDPKRNLKIYQKHLKMNEQFSPREQYYYSKELYYNGYYKKCIKELKKFLKMPTKFMPNAIDAYLTIAKCFCIFENYSSALKYLFEELNFFPPSSEVLCEIGNCFLSKSDFQKSLFFYECALLTSPNTQSGMFVDNNYYYLYPHLQLTMIYYRLGNFESAKKHHILAKKYNKNHPSVIYNEQFFNT